MNTAYYKDEASNFVSTAFNILGTYEFLKNSSNYDVTSIFGTLSDAYELRINAKGQLYLIRYDQFDPKGWCMISHTFGNKFSQITYIGKLLATYLENLQIDKS